MGGQASVHEVQIHADILFPTTLSPETADAIKALWRTPAIAHLLDNEELNLPASALHFVSDIQRLVQPDYTPTSKMFCTPAQKYALTETRFNMGALSMRLIDVGPLCSERRKWIHCFESVTSIIFCTALSDYEQVLLEERGLIPLSAYFPDYIGSLDINNATRLIL
ncbi:Heterotrimeric G-protein alpha subunit [Mycena sanguinolenta]|uniref:Heterotrimeric G-protein alpha subunit n=1 Tax=Mycena sanguinolenta TaxID=230812 RepID=A0A8H6Z8R3_9AGAR|nr:Heterotrimeric G-protein alpha subunit [Mycena sanguinolenta]